MTTTAGDGIAGDAQVALATGKGAAAHENHLFDGGINSLIGFQGRSDVIHHLKVG